jgi:hypothetical protein
MRGVVNMPYVKLDSLVITSAEIKALDSVVSKPTGAELRQFEVTGTLYGEADRDLFKSLGKVVDFEILGSDVMFRAQLENNSYRFTDGRDETDFSFIAVEYDPALPEEHDFQTQVGFLALEARLGTRTLTNLLIKKGILTKEDFQDEFATVFEREQETGEFVNKLDYGLEYKEPEEKDEAGE